MPQVLFQYSASAVQETLQLLCGERSRILVIETGADSEPVLSGVRSFLRTTPLPCLSLALATPLSALDDRASSQALAFDPTAIVVASDRYKVEVLSALARIDWPCLPSVLVFGDGHQSSSTFKVAELESLEGERSLATGYPLAKSHIFDALSSVGRRHSRGWFVELGVFRGGTLRLAHSMLQRLGLTDVKVAGFDTFEGFPQRKSLLDLYSDVGYSASGYAHLSKVAGRRGIELVKGDICQTAKWLDGKSLLVTFCDTDNYSPCAAALPICWRQTVVGGVVIFDHYHTRLEYMSTIGERVAAWEFFHDRSDFLHLTGTGVFVKVSDS